MNEHPYYCGIGDVFIDAHGSDHGLMVASDGETVTIREYSEFCEPNEQTGRWEGTYTETSVDIRELFRPDARHLEHVDLTNNRPGRNRKADIIINAALAWISYHGGSSDNETIVDVETDGGPCGFFGEYWPGTDEKHLRCEACETKRARDLADAVCSYAYRVWIDDVLHHYPSLEPVDARLDALKIELRAAIDRRTEFYIVAKASGKAISTPYGTSTEADAALENNPHMDPEHFQVIDGRWLNPCAFNIDNQAYDSPVHVERRAEIESALEFFGESASRWTEVDICDDGSVWLHLGQIIEKGSD